MGENPTLGWKGKKGGKPSLGAKRHRKPQRNNKEGRESNRVLRVGGGERALLGVAVGPGCKSKMLEKKDENFPAD